MYPLLLLRKEIWDTALRIRNMFSRAIIAREYGMPCVTGIPDAASIINTGDMITVDGYPGIIVIQKAEMHCKGRWSVMLCPIGYIETTNNYIYYRIFY